MDKPDKSLPRKNLVNSFACCLDCRNIEPCHENKWAITCDKDGQTCDKYVPKAVEKEELLKHLEKIEQWEAKWLMDDDCWNNDNPMITDDIFNQWLELQEERNKFLGRFKEGGSVC